MDAAEPSEGPGLLQRAARGDAEAFRSLFAGQRGRLKRLIRLRLRRDLAGRVDESRVVEEILDEAAARLATYAGEREPSRPLSLWVRDLACRRLGELHGRHPGSMGREGGVLLDGELTLHGGGLPIADAGQLAARILGGPAGSAGRHRADRRMYVQEAINSLEPIDREVIALRHFERLGFDEIALVLGLAESEAGRRYLGAIRRLRELLPWDAEPRPS